jgi:hypothetical protein
MKPMTEEHLAVLRRNIKLTNRRLRRGAFSGIVDLRATINRSVAEANECPRPFVWTADPHGIIEKVRRGRKVLALFG